METLGDSSPSLSAGSNCTAPADRDDQYLAGLLAALIAKMRGNRGDRGGASSPNAHPIKSVVILPPIVAAIFTLVSGAVNHNQPPRQT